MPSRIRVQFSIGAAYEGKLIDASNCRRHLTRQGLITQAPDCQFLSRCPLAHTQGSAIETGNRAPGNQALPRDMFGEQFDVSTTFLVTPAPIENWTRIREGIVQRKVMVGRACTLSAAAAVRAAASGKPVNHCT